MIVISVENLWKQYRYGTISHATLRRDIQSWWARFMGKEDPNSRIESNLSRFTFDPSQGEDRFWALRDINFEVKQGEVLGIIGRNGAGKSTLLKILSKVTTPTKGQIKIKGRVASLLEVGTGFHPELTGKENIFLNGAILGMTKQEIKNKFDEIVTFAEVENFIDTPVKRYSSGMYVRLAFAVAAHLDPEILVVDEVLAVGDYEFQQKCLGKMQDVSLQGRTVLFVSHNIATITRLCDKTILLTSGVLSAIGPTMEVIRNYHRPKAESAHWSFDKSRTSQTRTTYLTEAWLTNGVEEKSSTFLMGEDIILKAGFTSERILKNPALGVRIHASDGTVIGVVNHWMTYKEPLVARASAGLVFCKLKNLRLNPGRYFITLTLSEPLVDHYVVRDALCFEIVPNDVYGTGRTPNVTQGFMYLDAEWRFENRIATTN